MRLEILEYPDERLKEISKPVTQFDSKLHKLLDDMGETMYQANGVGLAAPQVGSLLRLFVIDIGTDEEEGTVSKLYEFINPKIKKGSGKIAYEEGCLSIPGFSEKVDRKEKITVEFQDRTGQPQTLDAEGLLAVAVQHENDHLDGVLFIDRLSPLKRKLARRKIEKTVTL